MSNRVRTLSRSTELGGKSVMCHKVVVRHIECMLPERQAVIPVTDLDVSGCYECQNDGRCGNGKDISMDWDSRQEVRDTPRHDQRQADERNIHVTIRNELAADLNQSDNRDQSS